MTIILDGSNKLWPDIMNYISFIAKHAEEIYDRLEKGDENAELIAQVAGKLIDNPRNPKYAAVLTVATERYIHDFHPDIATIKGGYPKEIHD